jgi:predicted GNAT family N-acyltransferase
VGFGDGSDAARISFAGRRVRKEPTPRMKVKLRQVRSRRDLEKAFAIRMKVFVREQGVPHAIELDADDAKAIHLLALVQERAVGAARVVLKRHTAKIGRMAVLKTYRGRGIGKELLKRAIKLGKAKGANRLYLHAQVSVIGFYEKLGFRSVGRMFVEAGIPHRKMILR